MRVMWQSLTMLTWHPCPSFYTEAEIVMPCLSEQCEQQARYPSWHFAAATLLLAATSGHIDTS